MSIASVAWVYFIGADVGEGCRRAIGDQRQRIAPALQFAHDVRRARDQVGA